MAWDIAVAGTLHKNDLVTPHGRRPVIHGGSSVYFSLAAGRHGRVHLHGIAGADSADIFCSILDDLPIDFGGLTVSQLPNHYEYLAHNFDTWTADVAVLENGCDPEWDARLTADAQNAPVLFVGSMHPKLQLHVLTQSRARLIGVDSMTMFIEDHRDTVESVAEGADVLFLNRTELAALVPTFGLDWRAAAESLVGRGRLRGIVVKAGPLGAACVTAKGVTELPAAPVAMVIDPTGAGDAVAGGFLGSCAEAERADEDFFVTALGVGLRYAAEAISAFGTEGLQRRAATPG